MVLLAFVGLACVVFSVYMVLIRKIKSSFNEFRESLIIYLVGITIYIDLVVLHVTVKKFPLNKNVRIVTTIFDIINAANPIWVFLAKPIYKCLFHHDEYLKEWLLKLCSDDLINEYAIHDHFVRTNLEAQRKFEKVGNSKRTGIDEAASVGANPDVSVLDSAHDIVNK
ncbi:hypothetical protein GGI12_004459 [Dipsacomyces acuminosporus]|nr:hypothetical protein GGI12_004459 [Dipsacomyces acuminosporus]